MRNYLLLGIVAIGLIALAAPAQAVVMYDGSGALTPVPDQTPNEMPWRWGYQTFNKSNPLVPSLALQAAASGATTLNSTSSMVDVAGYLTHVPNLQTTGYSYLRPDPQNLDADTGFTIGFTVQINSEFHISNDRAGFSLIALSDDPTPKGVELGFWMNEVWAQNVGFTHGESSGAFNTTASQINYLLHVQGSNYTLKANGSQILTGALRDYSSFSGGPPGNPGFPYNQPSLLFFGDDTSEASASIALKSIGYLSDAPQSFFQNGLPSDVDNNGIVGSDDANRVLEELDISGIFELSDPGTLPDAFFDVNGDSLLSPIDALIVIDLLNTPEQTSFGVFPGAVGVPEPSTAGYAWAVAFCLFVGYGFRLSGNKRFRRMRNPLA